MVLYTLIIGAIIVTVAIVLAVRKQARVTRTFTIEEKLAEKARDPRLALMTQEDLVYEVLKECFDPEIPLNVVDLGLVYEVKADLDAVNIKMSMTSQACP